jgi:hypothetical protein
MDESNAAVREIEHLTDQMMDAASAGDWLLVQDLELSRGRLLTHLLAGAYTRTSGIQAGDRRWSCIHKLNDRIIALAGLELASLAESLREMHATRHARRSYESVRDT